MTGTRTVLAAVFAFCASTAAAPIPQDADAPTAAQVIARAIDAMGGADAFAGLESYSFAGKQLKANGTKELAYELSYVHPDRVRGLNHSQIGPVIMVRNGDTGWIKAGVMKTMAANRDQLAPIEWMARLPRLVHDLEREFDVQPTVEVIEIDGRPAHRLELVRRAPLRSDGRLPHRAVFDAETGRILSFDRCVSRPTNAYVSTEFGEWQTFGEFTLFTRTSSTERGGAVEFQIDAFKPNEVDPELFAIPEELTGATGG